LYYFQNIHTIVNLDNLFHTIDPLDNILSHF